MMYLPGRLPQGFCTAPEKKISYVQRMNSCILKLSIYKSIVFLIGRLTIVGKVSTWQSKAIYSCPT